MISCLWLIVLFNAILGWYLIVFVLCFIKTIIRKNEKLIKNAIQNRILEEFGSDNPLAKEIESLDLGDEIGSMLDSRLNQITLQIASQIPMGEFLLAGSLGQKMKLKIREEIFRMLPELKNHFVLRISEKFDFKQLIQDHIDQFDFNELIVQVEKAGSADFFKLKVFGLLIGAAAGLVEVSLIFWFCK